MSIDFSIIISTVNDRIGGLALVEPDKFNYIIVHQVYGVDQGKNFAKPTGANVIYKRLDYPGLSKSRNIGLAICQSRYAYLMDDDVNFDPYAIKQLCQQMEEEQVDIGTSQYCYPSGKLARNYGKSSFQHNKLSVAKVVSIEICVKTESIRRSQILFDTKFGLGTSLPSGEEYIFLCDAIRAGLSVYYFPILIGCHPEESSGQDFYSSPDKILAKRMMLKRVFGRLESIFAGAFWVKKLPEALRAGYGCRFTRVFWRGE